jgi:hypothetical protein
MVLANVDGRPLTDAAFAPILERNRREITPGARASDGAAGVGRDGHGALPADRPRSAFTFDTSLAIAR